MFEDHGHDAFFVFFTTPFVLINHFDQIHVANHVTTDQHKGFTDQHFARLDFTNGVAGRLAGFMLVVGVGEREQEDRAMKNNVRVLIAGFDNRLTPQENSK